MFYKARDFTLFGCTFQNVQHVGHPKTVLERLAEHILVGSRFEIVGEDAPLCHHQTRLHIIKTAGEFYLPPRSKKIFWLSGPAGVGKTAIMRSIARSEGQRIGATIFFSKANERTDSHRFVQTIAYQLAVQIPAYQQIVADKLAADPMLLGGGTKELFKKLIEMPFRNLNDLGNDGPWMILIDGLDECDGEGAQREIVEMIGAFVHQYPASSLVWIIASRAENSLRVAFSQQVVNSNCHRERIEIDTPEARREVEIYLESEFNRIRSAFADQFSSPQSWPTRRQFNDLAKSASGLFLLASTASRFIGDSSVGNPTNQLTILLSAIKNGGVTSGKESPLSPLHNVYSQILSSTSRETFISVTRRILGCCRLLPRNTIHTTSFALSCNFLGIAQHDAYSSLQRLHSVLDVPSPTDAAVKEMKILHSSFYEFLENQSVAQDYYVGRQDAGVDIVRCSFRILQEANRGAGPLPQSSKITLTWQHPDRLENAREMLLNTAYDGFRLLAIVDNVPDQLSSSLLAEADFSKLDCYLNPSVKTTVHKARRNHPVFFEWLIEKWKAKPDNFKDTVKELSLWKVRTHSIRIDRAVIHFRFTLEGKNVVVRPRVYSGCEDIRRKFNGESLESFKQILRDRRFDSPATKVQMWGRDRRKSCLLFQCDGARAGDKTVVKEIFFIPYLGSSSAAED